MRWSDVDTARSIPKRFDQMARRYPDQMAIVDGPRSLTYPELGRLADRYAAALPRIEACRDGRGARAAILLDHGAPVMAGALAALSSGFTAVVLNPQDPPARHEQIRAAVRPSVLLTDRAQLEHGRAAGFEDRETVLVSATPEWDGSARERPPAEPDDLSFLLTTSGTTGRPKAVMQTHRNLLHGAMRNANRLEIVPADRIAWLAPLSGAHGLSTAMMVLMNGATLCPFSIVTQGLIGLRDWLAECGATVLDTSPSVLRNFSRTLAGATIPGIRLVRLTSEAALRTDFDCFRRHFPPDAALAVMLGSSETGTVSTAIYGHEDDPAGEVLSVGTEPEGIRVLLVDPDRPSTTAAEVGEIVVLSRYLSPGYWGDEQLTAERFEGAGQARRFHTHDLGRRSGSGELTLFGRVDSQIKIRGHRLQPEEVEGVLAAQPGVAGAAVAVRQSSRGDSTLTAYVMAAPGWTLDTDRVRRSLGTVLPAHAVPTSWVRVDALPVTPNGKIDRARLADLEPVPAVSSPALLDRPVSRVERVLLTIWEELLDHRPIGLDDDFFSIGGDSLAAMEMLAAIEERLDCSLTPAALIESPTVEALSRVIGGRSRLATVVAPRAGLADVDRPPLFLAPGLGQSGLRFRLLAEALGPGFPLRALEVPWWDGRPSKIRTVEQLAALHVQQIQEHQPTGPYLVGGSSFGGRVALEIARQLAAVSHDVALLVVFDTYVGVSSHWTASPARRLAARARWRLRQRGFGALRQTDRAAYVGHRTVGLVRSARPSPYGGQVVLFRCMGTPCPAPDRGWGSIARGALEIHDLACQHDEQFEVPFVHQLAPQLAEVLQSAYDTGDLGLGPAGSVGRGRSVVSSA